MRLLLGFKTPPGVWTIAGVHVLPVWLYAARQRATGCNWGQLASALPTMAIVILVMSRMSSLYVVQLAASQVTAPVSC